MGQELKYIMIQLGKNFFLPVLFPKLLIHRDVASGMERACQDMGDIVSAGFVYYDNKNASYVAYGRSESLNLDSDKEDGKRITEFYK